MSKKNVNGKKTPDVTGKKEGPPRNGKGQFPPGTSGNPEGRPKGSRNAYTRMWKAIEAFEDDQKKDFFKMIIHRSISRDPVLVKLMDKLLPNLNSISLRGGLDNTEQITHDVRLELLSTKSGREAILGLERSLRSGKSQSNGNGNVGK